MARLLQEGSVGIQVRKARPDDFTAIESFDALMKNDPRHCNLVREAIDSGSCIVAHQDAVVGFAIVDHSFLDVQFVRLIVVAETCRRRGIARRLLGHIESTIDDAKLFTSTNRSNMAAQRLLEGVGFVRSGVVENLDPGDAELIYVKWLNNHD